MPFQASLSTKFDEQEWVVQIRQALEEELEEETETPATIFSVPKPLIIAHPDSYIPQHIAIGPQHHLRPELHDMERHKVAAAKRNQKGLWDVKIRDIVDHLIKFEAKIRASYHRPVRFGSEALAWMMVVDACFLFEFFQACNVKRGLVLTKDPSRWARLSEIWRNETARNAILRDVIMLENQIPMSVMRMLLEFQFLSPDLGDEVLRDMLIGLCKELSPLKTVQCSQRIEVKDRAHLLDFLYHSIIAPDLDFAPEVIVICEEKKEEEQGGQEKDPEDEENNNSFSKSSYWKQLLSVLWQVLLNLVAMQRIIFSKPAKLVAKLPWTILFRTPLIETLKESMGNRFRSFNKDDEQKDEGEELSSSSSVHKPPLLEEITIPSVTELHGVGVKFLPTNGGITGINFDRKSLNFYLPIIVLDVNSEAVLRNLVAYEAGTASGPLVVTRYTELMNGIIDTEMDVKILSDKGIIVNHLKSEKEVAELWNGMSRSIRLSKVPSLDKVIADVNRYYNGRWKVKFGSCLKHYVFRFWKILTFLASVVILLLMSLQAFCQVYGCGRIFSIEAFENGDQ